MWDLRPTEGQLLIDRAPGASDQLRWIKLLVACSLAIYPFKVIFKPLRFGKFP